MAYTVTSEKYQSDEITIEEILVELNDDEFVLNRSLEGFESDTLVVIQNISGEVEHFSDFPFEETSSSVSGATYAGLTNEPSRLLLGFRALGFAKAKVFISQVRRGFTNAFKGFPCKLCKLAVKTVVSTILVQLGVPVGPTGEFDLKAFVISVTNAGADIANGVYGQVVQALSSLLPANWWNVVLNLLHGANWLLDATDAFFQKVCRFIGMCLPPSQATP